MEVSCKGKRGPQKTTCWRAAHTLIGIQRPVVVGQREPCKTINTDLIVSPIPSNTLTQDNAQPTTPGNSYRLLILSRSRRFIPFVGHTNGVKFRETHKGSVVDKDLTEFSTA